MNQFEMKRIAKIAINKKWDFETLKYSDYLYGKEQFAESIWDYVEECEMIGKNAFYDKYPTE